MARRTSLALVAAFALVVVALVAVVAPPSTEQASAADSDFVESFDGNTGLNRFDYGVWHRGDEFSDGTVQTWSGDHNAACGSPDTQRVIRRDQWRQSFYTCRDHLMTSVGDVSPYSLAWFTPKGRTFFRSEQNRVSWEVNMSYLGGRQWWEVMIYPAGHNYNIPRESADGTNCQVCATEAGMADTANIHAYKAGAIAVGNGPFGTDVNISTHQGNQYSGWRDTCENEGGLFPESVCLSKATRVPFSITDNLDGTITVDYGGQWTETFAGSFPNQFKVVFKDHSYTPDKDGPVAGYTWHWDNIAVTGADLGPPRDVHPVVPARVYETRSGQRTVDGLQQALGRRRAGQISEVLVAGRGGVPSDAAAAVVNLTAVNPSSRGHATAYPCGSAKPNASTINFAAGQVIANGATIKLGGRKMCIYTQSPTDLLVDVTGFVPATSAVKTVVPARVFETRSGQRTVDGQQQGVGRRGAGQVTQVNVAGRGGVPSNAAAAVVNLTAINPSSRGYATAYPCGSAKPNASTINFAAGQVIANGATIKLGGGKICVYTHRAMDFVLDVTAYVPAGSDVKTIVPARMFESRAGQRTVDGRQQAVGRRRAGQITQVDIGGRAGVPGDALAAIVNITAVNPSVRGYATAFPCGFNKPNASTINFAAGQVIANGATIRLGGGKLCVFTYQATDLVVDVVGYVER